MKIQSKSVVKKKHKQLKIIVYGENESEHKNNLEILFKRLEQNGFKVNAPKCIIGVVSC